MSIEVLDPEGVRWRVRRRWAPRHNGLLRRFNAWRAKRRAEGKGGRDSKLLDFIDIPLVGESLTGVLVGIALMIGFVVSVLLLWFVVFPFVLLVVDLLIVILLAALGTAARVLLGRPWTIEATSDTGATRTWNVAGALRSRRACREAAEALASGTPYLS